MESRQVRLVVDEDKCISCGVCTRVCACGVMSIAPGRGAQVAHPERCMGCGHCVSYCPKGAVRVEGCGSVEDLELCGKMPSFEDLATAVAARRSVREYAPEAPSRETFEKLIQAARYAPTGCNARDVRYYVVTAPEALTRLRDLTADFLRVMVKEDPAHYGGFAGIVRLHDKGQCVNIIASPALLVLVNNTPSENAEIAATTVDLLAPALGLGTCWAGLVIAALQHYPPMKDYARSLGIEGLDDAGAHVCALMIGTARVPPVKRAPVRPPAPVVFI